MLDALRRTLGRSRTFRWIVALLAGSAALTLTATIVLSEGPASGQIAARELLRRLPLDNSGLSGVRVSNACGAAVDSHENIYISASARPSVRIFDRTGKYLAGIRSPNGPCALAVNSHGDIYVLESHTGDVVTYSPSSFPFDGRPTYSAPKTIDASGKAKGIGIDPYDDRLFVAKGDRIDVYKLNGTLGQNEVQRVLVAEYSGGMFTLSFGDETTMPLPYDATNSEVESALGALSSIGAGNVSVREGTHGPTDHFISFIGSLGGTDVAMLKADTSHLKGRDPGHIDVELLVRASSGHIGEGMLTNAVGVGAYTYNGAETEVGGLLAEDARAVLRRTPLRAGEPRRQLVSLSSPNIADDGAEGTLVDHRPQFYHGFSRYVFVADAGGAAADRIVVFGGRDIGALDRLRVRDDSKAPDGRIGLAPRTASIAVDQQSGHFLVYDSAHSVIDEFEATGHYVAQFEASSFDSLAQAGIAADRPGGPTGGRAYVAASGDELLIFGPPHSRAYRAKPAFIPDTKEVCGGAVDSLGNLYLGGERSIEVFDPDGDLLSEIETQGRQCPASIDSAGNFYAIRTGSSADSANDVVVYQPDSFPPDGSIDFGPPRKILSEKEPLRWAAVNPANDHLLVRMDEYLVVELGSVAEGSPRLGEIMSKEVLRFTESFSGGVNVCGQTGDIYISGRGPGGGRIYVLNPTGTELRGAIDGSGSPRGVFEENAFDIEIDQSNCHIFIAMNERAIEEYETSGTFVAEFGPNLYLDTDLAVDNGSSSTRGDVYAMNEEGLYGFEAAE